VRSVTVLMYNSATADGQNPRVIGLITGIVNGRTIEIHNSFEASYTMEGDVAVLNDAFVKERQAQCMPEFATVALIFCSCTSFSYS